MTFMPRFACLSFVALSAVAVLGGCQSTTQFQGNPSTAAPISWSSGQNIYVDVRGGTIRLADSSTAVKVVQGTDANVHVTFSPFTSDTDKARADMELTNNLVLSAGPGVGGTDRFPSNANLVPGVLVQVLETGTHQSALSARVDLTLPTGFDGALYIITDSGDILVTGTYGGHTNAVVSNEGKIDITYGGGVAPAATASNGVNALTTNGDIIVTGSTGNVFAHTDLGNIEVDVGTATTGTETGDILTKQGDITLVVPSASVMAIESTSGVQGAVTYKTPPASWVPATNNTANSATIAGNGGANVWRLDSSGFFTSNIEVDFN